MKVAMSRNSFWLLFYFSENVTCLIFLSICLFASELIHSQMPNSTTEETNRVPKIREEIISTSVYPGVPYNASSPGTCWEFPNNFLFGAATSAYQTEGGWNADGRGPSIWDVALHANPSVVEDVSNGDVTGDSYHLFDKDLEIIKELGLNFYRFSISWSRILPTGDISSLNRAGIRYYHMMIDKLLAANITPMVTMFHFDLPNDLQKLGGPLNSLFIDYFARYATLLFDLYGDRVKHWLTINEPRLHCVASYGTGFFAPNINASGIGDYVCGDNLLKAHASVYNIYKDHYFKRQGGKVGIVLDTFPSYVEHENGTSTLSDKAMQYYIGWMAHPLLSQEGDYPAIMRREIDRNSEREGRAWSRLPKLDKRWSAAIKGAVDFIGINYYTSQNVRLSTNEYDLKNPSFAQDIGFDIYYDPKWQQAGTGWLYLVPYGIRDVLKWMKDQYGDIELIVTENGWADRGMLKDYGRVDYLKRHLEEVLKAIYIDHVNVTGYTYWSLLDSFEWVSGFKYRFGLYSVNFTSSAKERSPKFSAQVYKSIIANRKIP